MEARRSRNSVRGPTPHFVKAAPGPLKAFICGQIGCNGAAEHHKEY